MSANRWKCDDCDAITAYGELLQSVHPFDRSETIYGCPACLGLDLSPVCDEPGCVRVVSCGTPTADGYRSTCWTHKPERSAS